MDKIRTLLLETLQKAKARKTRVASVIVTRCGHIYEGCNIESSCLALSVCAERAAVFNAVIHQGPEFVIDQVYVLAIKDGKEQPIVSCGGCLQVISEFSDEQTRIDGKLLSALYTSQYR